ncbi:aldehyde dehydrogenase [Paenibacillus montanisoli]|uniref:Aldehyde dehydrogenase n=1 Tax=Paenibacillus montanisoli TaxID=2081970 RepID=A0A328TVX3_9BACL|nr:aldehyde dehydrogenase [Paenibacillus montanisoli]RAP74637.1 aldehyde dehydrogenase family protein [Paenibacillus montanisoli]
MANVHQLLERQQAWFRTGESRSYAFRLTQLKKLKQAVAEREAAILAALRADLNKSEHEAYTLEIGPFYTEINFAIKHLRAWMKPKRVRTPMTHLGSRSTIMPEPLGSVLIISPWNYPFNLTLTPLIGAIAAGNTAILKPSELSPAISGVLESLAAESFQPEYITVVQGGAETSRELVGLPFDHIFYTGGTAVGKLVMAAAAPNLTPVTLELGGKSPCIVHHDASIALAARRIAFGKFLNSGQTCVAPDYLLVHRSVKGALLEAIGQAVTSFYGEEPLKHPDYGRIASRRHYERLKSFLQDGKAVIGGGSDDESLRIAPTILEDVAWSSPVMQEEIFGPILPVFTYEDPQEAIALVNARPRPLALYVFSQNEAVQRQFTSSISFGGGCINDTMLHLGSPYLPFGGVGQSGIGSYHGEYSFRTFSHMKSVLKQTTAFDFPFRYPSFKNGIKIIRMLMKP